MGILILKEPSWVRILLSSERKNFQTTYSNQLYRKKIKIYVYGVHNRPRLCHSFLLLGHLTLRSTHEVHLRKRLTGPKYAIKIEDNEVDELKPKVFNLVVSFNMFNWKENSTKEYGERAHTKCISASDSLGQSMQSKLKTMRLMNSSLRCSIWS